MWVRKREEAMDVHSLFYFKFLACSSQNAEMKFNFGATSFKYPPGYGYKGVSEAPNLVPFSGPAPSPAGGGGKKGSGRKTPMAIII